LLFKRSAIRWIVAISLLAGLAALALKFLPIPFAWVGIAGAAVGFACISLVANMLKLPLVVAASCLLAVGLAELVLPATARPIVTTLPASDQKDPLLGWTLVPSRVSHAVAKVGDQIIFDVKYTVDPSGRRVAPPDRGASAEGCALFFADSFVFGVGVEDTQTLPYQVGLKADGRFRVINHAVGGYGAEHMLAAIERGTLAGRPLCEPTHVVYVALPHHVPRAAGKTYFSTLGPRYRLKPDGNPEYLGTNPEGGFSGWRSWRFGVGHQLAKSRLLFKLMDRPPPTTDEDLKLYFSIVDLTFRLFKQHWPKAALHIISWDIHPHFANGTERFHAGLRGVPATIHLIDDILPGYSADNNRYGLHPADLHPNAMALEMTAAYVAGRILGATSAANGADQPAK
jgi:hypothetical protein